MAQAQVNIAFEQGVTFDKLFQWLDKDGQPKLDLTNATIFGQVRATEDDATVLVEFSDAEGTVTIEDGPNAKFRLRVEAEDTEPLDFEEAVWDIKITVETTTYSPMGGSAFVDPSPTKQFI